MTRTADEVRRLLVDARAVVEALGLAEGAMRQARGLTIRCPWHIERTPSCSVTVGPDGTLRAHCFGCGRGGDVLHLVAAARGLDLDRDFRRVLDEAAQLAGLAIKETSPRRASLPRVGPSPPVPSRPPAGEVAELWASCVPVFDDVELRAALQARAIDAACVSDRDLARALPKAATLPSWARIGRQNWADVGNRLVLPMFDATGALVTFHARRLGPGAMSKGLSPAGHQIAGAVFADPLGRMLLATGAAPDWWREHVVIVEEGAPDFLAVAAHYGDDESTPAVFGVIAGAWTRDIGARIPDGCHVIIRTHADAAGEKYAAAVGASLVDRCRLSRAEAA